MNYFRQYRPAKHTTLPPGVLNLIIINVILFVAKQFAESRGIDMGNILGLHHPFAPDFTWYQYLTSMFMHADAMHLIFNMIGLWLFGYMLENAFGTKRFMIFYLVAGLGASAIYQVWMSIVQYKMMHANLIFQHAGFWDLMQAYPPYGYLIGASGAVFGLLMGSALLFPNTQLPYMGFLGFPMKVKWIALIYGGGELLRSFQAQEDHVAHFAHIGGMIFGFILVKIYSRNRTSFY